MSWTETEWVSNTEAIDRLYLEQLGRRLDPNGLGSRVGYHMREQGRTLDWFRELLAWGELPPDKFIADGWDDGRWPMLLPGRPEAQQDAAIQRAKDLHRNSFVLLAANPDEQNPPTYDPPSINPLLLAALTKVQAAGLKPFVFLWSREAEDAWSDGRQRVKAMRDVLPAELDVACIETDEYWDDSDLADVSTYLSGRHRFWCHYRPRVLEPVPATAHGLMLQLEPDDDLLTWLRRARGEWGSRPICLAEVQGAGATSRWAKFQDWLRYGGYGGTHVGAAR